MVREVPYGRDLPDELKELHYYISDSGHCILCILKMHLDKARQSDMYNYEVPVPARYVLENGYEVFNGHVVVDAEYSSSLGLIVDESYFEY
jgi:hypothetical protein